MSVEFSGRGGDRSYSGLVRSFGRAGGPGYIPFAGASEAAPRPGQVHESMREKAARKAARAAASKRPAAVDNPVTVRRVAPTVPSGTRAARLRTRPPAWTGQSAEHMDAAENAARSTYDTMEAGTKENQPRRREGGKIVDPPYTDWDNADDVFEDERTNKGRLRGAEMALAAEVRDSETRRIVKANRSGHPNDEDSVWDARKRRSAKKKLDIAREASRQKSVGIRSPAVTKAEVEQRKKNVGVIERLRTSQGPRGVLSGRKVDVTKIGKEVGEALSDKAVGAGKGLVSAFSSSIGADLQDLGVRSSVMDVPNTKIMSTNPAGGGAKASTFGGRSWMWNIGRTIK